MLWKNKPCSEGFNTHLWDFQGDRWENIHFESKPRHVTPEINCIGKTSPVLRVSTPIYGISREIDGKTFILRVNLGMWPPQIDCLGKMSPVLRVPTPIYAVFQEDRWQNIHFESKPRHVIPQIDCCGKTSPVLRVSTPIYGISKEIDGKTFILRVNLGMWPLKSIVLEKQALFWGFQHPFMGFPGR